MTTGRCTDPNCTCRSPDLQWFTNQVLRRDGKKTDYIVIPLVAGVLVRCMLAEELPPGQDRTSDQENESTDRARAVMELVHQSKRGEHWDEDSHGYGVIADLVFCNWASLLSWGSISYVRKTLGIGLNASRKEERSAVLRWLNARPGPSLTESTIIAAMVAVRPTEKNEVPLLGKDARHLRVALADRLRRENLLTWPDILAAGINDWTLETVQRLAQHHAAAGDSAIHHMMDLSDATAAAAAAAAAEAESDAPPKDYGTLQLMPNTEPSEHRDAEVEAAESLLEDAATEIQHWRAQRDRVQHERDVFADRDSRSRSRIESLEHALETAALTRRHLEKDLIEVRAERDQLAERFAVEEALAPGAPPQDPATFTGRRVLLFTGVEAADARAALAQGFWDLGAAQVDTYWTDKTRGPDTFPPDAIVAADVTFMSHSAWNSIQDRARASGTWAYTAKHGAATMGRATAAAWRAHLAHTERSG